MRIGANTAEHRLRGIAKRLSGRVDVGPVDVRPVDVRPVDVRPVDVWLGGCQVRWMLGRLMSG